MILRVLLSAYPWLCLAIASTSAWLLRTPTGADFAFGLTLDRSFFLMLAWLLAATGYLPAAVLDLRHHRALATVALAWSAALCIPGMSEDSAILPATTSPSPSEYATGLRVSLALLACVWLYPRLESDIPPDLGKLVSLAARAAVLAWSLFLLLCTLMILR